MEGEWTLYTGEEDFEERDDVYRVRVAPHVNVIRERAFRHCPYLREVDLGNAVVIGKTAFCRCESLVRIRLPPTVTEIETVAFARCTALVEVEFCEGLQIIGEGAFYDCRSLKRFISPSTLTEILKSAFWQCSALTEVVFHEGLRQIGDRAFSETSVESVSITSALIGIGENSFSACSSLRAVTFGEGTHNIKGSTFSDCDSLPGLSIPHNSFYIYCRWSDDVPRCFFIKDWILPRGQGNAFNSTMRSIISGKLGNMGPNRSLIIQGAIDNILGREGATKVQKLDMIRTFIDQHRMVDATTALELAIRKAGIDVRGEQDVETIIIGGVLPFLKNNGKWFYL
ncbi:hypothetical protein ACHAWF_016885 [Thalassiosira exigua]